MRTLLGTAFLILGGLAAAGSAAPPPPFAPEWQPALRDPTDRDTTDEGRARVDTVDADRYLPPRRPRRAPTLFPRERTFLGPRPQNYRYERSLDSTSNAILLRERVGDLTLTEPLRVDSAAYRRAQLRRDLAFNWQSIAEERARQRQQQGRGGLGLNIAVPGGRESTFTTIFGTPTVDLRITGQADINAGFDYRRSDQQVAFTGSASQLDPSFEQKLRLGITGSVGDKMRVDVNWDTNNQFEYQNQVKLTYTGYEDEILQSVEAGNVFLETPSSLIRGGQSLFGIKSQFQVGGLQLTTVASQQEGQSSSLTIQGGAETSRFGLLPTDYDDNRHFFLGYYFRNRWEEAHADPPTILKQAGFDRITEVEVWVSQTTADAREEDVRLAAAVVDLGEPADVLAPPDPPYDGTSLPDEDADQYDPGALAALQDGQSPEQFGLQSSDYATGKFRRLERGTDYTFDDQLGYLSLRQRLQDNEALAIAFRYVYQGQTFTVGDLTEAGGTTGGVNADRIVLKLLRPSNPTQPSAGQGTAAWYLQLRNIYALQGRNFDDDSFDLDLSYAPPGQSSTRPTLPDSVLGQEPLLQLLGLDRVTRDLAPQPDNRFDFIPGYTIDPQEGLLIFPYLEPYGERLATLIEAEAGGGEAETLKEQYVFSSLYEKKKALARKEDSRYEVYQIEGTSQGSAGQSFYDLRAIFGVVEGSVRVTSGGQTLQEGTDYQVDYQGGTVTVINEQYLSDGRDLRIEFEQNAAFQAQKKTLLGARADYAWSDRMALGATVMRMSERAVVDKFRIGEEPIANTIWGVDGSIDLEPDWLTRAVDALPLVQTRARSTLALAGEFAQFRPGHTQTNAFERTRRSLQDEDRDFYRDEVDGISYIDDFEGFENTLSLKSQLPGWKVSAPPATYRPPTAPDAASATDAERSRWRGTLGWYQLNRNIIDQLDGKAEAYDPEAVRLVDVRDVFPNRDTRGQVDNALPTMDLYFDPSMRGPYNYTRTLDAFQDRPEAAWGGMTLRLPEGYNDFGLQNIEFVEFTFKPFPENEERSAASSARLYLNLGSISEDVIADGRLSTEDGLSTGAVDPADFTPDGIRLPQANQNSVLNIDGQRTEDLGLDGLVSYAPENYPELVAERVQLADFVDAAQATPGAGAEAARIANDPSGDDYHYFDDDSYFGDETLFPDGASFQQRFTRFYAGQELNAYETQNALATSGPRRGNARDPDSEDLNFNAAVDTENDYFEYALPLSRAALDSLARPTQQEDFVVSKNNEGWYLVRIPIRTADRRTIGSIQDFSRVESMRLWTEGHDVPVTLRFATLELVGSQWRSSDRVALREDAQGRPVEQPGSDGSRLTIASVNNEENDDVYEIPLGTIVPQTQTTSGQRQNIREQSLVLQVDSLDAGRQRAIFKSVSNLNLLKYTNLRMFAHLHGMLDSGLALDTPDRGRVRLFVRLGANQSDDYYEYEQPLTPSRLDPAASSDDLWRPDENGINIQLSALNQLKVARDEGDYDSRNVLYTDNASVPGLPAPEAFAPAGTRLGIKGSPSLQNVNTIVIGVRNASGELIESATLWLNELRATGYDEEGGWAALANAEVKLADLARVSANVQSQTDGFGSLSSTLNERQQNDVLDWSLLTELYADQFLPARYGWSIPVTVQLQSQTATPRYAPSRGDVRIEEILDQIDANQNLSESERDRQREAVIRRAQTHRTSRSLTARLQKQGSSAWLMRNTLDALSLSYSYADAQARSPQQRLDDNWRWTGTMQYRLRADRPRPVRPLGFLDETPVLGALSDLTFNYLPQSLSFSTSASRRFFEQQARPTDPLRNNLLPERLRSQHNFTVDRQFDIQYNPFNFLNLNLGTVTNQSLNDLATETRYRAVFETEDGFDTEPFDDADDADDFLEENDLTGFTEELLHPRTTGSVVGDLIGDAGPRTDRYQQRFAATLRPALLGGESLNWIGLDDISYQVTFGWQNGPIGRQQGARVNNNVQLRGGLTLQPRLLWQKLPAYERLEGAPDSTASLVSRFLRRAVLAVTGIDNVSITYSGSREATSTNVTEEAGTPAPVGFGFIDAFQGEGLPLGYQFGLTRRIDPDRRLDDPALQVYDLLQDGNQLQARTVWRPDDDLQVSLNWDLNWSRGQNITYGLDTRTATENGRNRSSVWAFGASYRELLLRQLETLSEDFDPAADVIEDDGDGRIALTNRTLTDDFGLAYLRGPGSVDGLGLLPFPMPGWTVTYSGLGAWPLLRWLTESITLRHSYAAEYTSDYRSNSVAGNTSTYSLGSYTVRYVVPGVNAGGANVQERYQPLIGAEFNWQGGLETDVSWSRANTYRLSTSNSFVTENRATELSFTASYRKTGLELPLIPVGRLNNRVDLSLTTAWVANDERRYSLTGSLADALPTPDDFDLDEALQGDGVSVLEETSRLTVTPKVGYQFSNSVQADFVVQYEQFNGNSRRPSYTSVNGGFNVRVSLSN